MQPVQPMNAGQQAVQPMNAGQQAIQPMNAGQQAVQPIIIQTTTSARTVGNKYEGLKAKAVLILGIIQVVVGILCIVINIAGIAIHAQTSEVGHGIWCGVIFIIAGAFGICAGKNKTLCPIITFMILSIIAAVFTIPLLTTAAIALSTEERNSYYYRYNYDNRVGNCYYNCRYSYYSSEKLGERQSVHSFLIILALLEAVVAIVSSAYCCHGVCCCRTASTGQVITYPGQTVQYITQPNAQGQIILIQNPGQGPQQANIVYPQAGPANPQYGPGACSGYPHESQAPQQGQQHPPVYSSAPPPEYSSVEVKEPLEKTHI